MIDNDITSSSANKSLRKKAEGIVLKREHELFISTDDMSSKNLQEIIHELQVHQIELEMQNDELLIANNNLKDSQDRYFDLYYNAPIGYCTISEIGSILEVNSIVQDLLGLNRHALIKKSITDFIFKEDQDIYYLHRKKFFLSDNETSCELRMVDNNGKVFWVRLSATSETNISGFKYIKIVIIDITHNKKTQDEIQKLNNNLQDEIARQLEELRNKDRLLLEQATLAQLGEMISMIAHQWRQPLNVISGTAVKLSLLNILGNVSEDVISENTKLIQDVAQRMSNIIDDFMNFNKKTDDDVLLLFNSVKKTYAIIESQFIARNITVNIDVNKGISIFHNKRSIEHSLLNILMNARDAFEEHPNIEEREISIYTYENGNTVTLFIEDNAGGIAHDIIGKIFNPYFTTKEQGKGTGLGLYMTKKMIENDAKSTISVESKDNKTIFSLNFQRHGVIY